MKRGIALLITLLLLTTLSLLLLKSYSINDKFSQNEKELKTFYQEERILKDIKPIIKKKLKYINSAEAYSFLFSQTFPLKSKYINIELTFSPVENRINPNRLLKNGKVNKPLKSLLEDILISYNISDTNFFIDILLDTIDDDTNERSTDSEIATNDILFRNKAIYNYEHFKKIVDYYAQSRDDKNVYNISWRDFLIFEGNGDININFAPLKLLKFMLPENYIDKSFKKDYYENFKDLKISKEDENRLKNLNISFKVEHVYCHLRYKDSNNISFKKDFILSCK